MKLNGSYANLTNEELFITYRTTRNPILFNELVTRTRPMLINYLRRRVGDNAEDVAQDTFIRVHEKRHLFDATKTFAPWLFCIARNLAKDLLRYEARRPHIELDQDVLYDPEERDLESIEKVRGGIKRLSPMYREPVHLVHFQGYRYRQAARKLGIPVGTVKSRLNTAFNHLRMHCSRN